MEVWSSCLKAWIHRTDAHKEEYTVQHRLRHQLQQRRQGNRAQQQQVDEQMRGAPLDDLGDFGGGAAALELDWLAC